jgi:hypothetical protein
MAITAATTLGGGHAERGDGIRVTARHRSSASSGLKRAPTRAQGTRARRPPARNRPGPRSCIRGKQWSCSRYRVPCKRASLAVGAQIARTADERHFDAGARRPLSRAAGESAASVEQVVQVASQRHSVWHGVLAARNRRPDARGVEHRKHDGCGTIGRLRDGLRPPRRTRGEDSQPGCSHGR